VYETVALVRDFRRVAILVSAICANGWRVIGVAEAMAKLPDIPQKHCCAQPTALPKALAQLIERNLVLRLAVGPELQLSCEKS
jgi:hypothetical protein